MRDLRFDLLGPLAVRQGGRPVVLGGTKQRTALALLLLDADQVVSTSRLVDGIWPVEPPETALTALHGHVSRLRKLLGAETIVTQAPGYRLRVDADAVDLFRFERLSARAREEAPERAAPTLREALALWRGPALADLADEPAIAHEAARLDELRLAALEELFELELALGRHAALVPELEAAIAVEPLRERFAAQLMLALYRTGRQADALAAYRRARRALVEAAGIEPGPLLRDLERRILAQDARLAPAAFPGGGSQRRETPETRGVVTVLAARLGTAAAAGGRPDPEPLSHVVLRWRSEARRTLERHGASIEVSRGSVIAAFGLPQPLEDHALRAGRAAGEIVEATAALDGELAGRLGIRVHARIGIATGQTFAAEGPAYEEALRLLEAAAPGETLLDVETGRLLEGAAALDEVAPERFRLVGLHALTGGRVRRFVQPLVGREPESRRLRDAFDEVAAGAGCRLVAVVGPPGIGKSRLVEEAVESLADEATVLAARCPSYGDGIDLLPVLELLRAAAGVSERDAAEAVRGRLRAVLDDDDRAETVVERLLGILGVADDVSDPDEATWAVRRLFEALARRGPLVIVLDDLQWARPPVLRILEQLVVRSRGARILILATARALRGDDLAFDPTMLELEPLADTAVEELIAGVLGSSDIDAGTLGTLVDAAGGNPLFAEELVHTLQGDGALRHVDGRWRATASHALVLPTNVRALLAMRLESLDPDERELLSRAAVIGRSFTRSALDALGGPPSGAALDELAAGDIVRPGANAPDGYEFRHLLIREAAYATLPHARRAVLHERYAAWLERPAPNRTPEREALAAHHLDEAYRAHAVVAPGDDRLADVAGQVAEKLSAVGAAALARGEAGTAARLLSRARELRPHDGPTLVALGRALLEAGSFAEADEAFAAAEPFAPAHARVGRLDVRLRTDPSVDVDDATKTLDAATEELLRLGDDRGLADAWVTRGYLAVVRCRALELSTALEVALRHARRAGPSRTEGWILLLGAAACWYGPMPVPAGIRRCREILQSAEGRPALEAGVLQSLGVLQAMAGRSDEGRALVARSRAIQGELGQEVTAAGSVVDAGLVELLAGDYAAAERVLREGYDVLERLGEKAWFATVASLLAEAVEAQDRPAEAAALVRAAREAAGDADLATQIGWRATQARLHARDGEHREAERLAREATALAADTDFTLPRAEAFAALADVLRSAGQSDTSELARAEAVALLEAKGLARGPLAARARLTEASSEAG